MKGNQGCEEGGKKRRLKEIEGNFRNILSLFAHVVPNLYTDICMSNTEKGELLKIPYSSVVYNDTS